MTLGAAGKASEGVTDVAVILLDRECQAFSGEELMLRNEPMEAFSAVRNKDAAFDADFFEMFLTGCVITPT